MSSIAVTGASGYIGGRLVPRLLEQGHQVKVLTRNADSLRDVPWFGDVTVVEGALSSPEVARELCADTQVAYFLVHSMTGDRSFASIDDENAQVFAEAARAAGVGHLVYLSGLHPDGELSEHLRSRVRVGEILEESGVPTLTLQAGLVIGSGSASFEMVRHLTDVLPVMPSPQWVKNMVQPIAVRDALHYLVAAAEVDLTESQRCDIGGPEAYSYATLMRYYAQKAGMKPPRIIPLPVLTPWLAAQWVNLVTPIPKNLAVPLVGSLQHDCVVQEHSINDLIAPPAAGLTDYGRAVELALNKISADEVETTWATAHPLGAPSEPLPSDPDWSGRSVLIDQRRRHSTASPEKIFAVIEQVGGERGYFSLSQAWKIRGLMDKVVGGVGLNRGRRSRSELALGDVLDWWRVEAITRGRMLRLRAEMKVPGQAWLEFSVTSEEEGTCYQQRAIFFPRGLSGRLYWLALVPFHAVIFRDMASRIVAEAEHSEKISSL